MAALPAVTDVVAMAGSKIFWRPLSSSLMIYQKECIFTNPLQHIEGTDIFRRLLPSASLNR